MKRVFALFLPLLVCGFSPGFSMSVRRSSRLLTAPSLAIASCEEVLAELQDRINALRSAMFFGSEPLRIALRLRNVTWDQARVDDQFEMDFP